MGRTVSGVLLGDTGINTVVVNVRDTIGSTSAAMTEVTVADPAEPPSVEEVTDLLVSTSSLGDPLITLAAVDAVANAMGDTGE